MEASEKRWVIGKEKWSERWGAGIKRKKASGEWDVREQRGVKGEQKWGDLERRDGSALENGERKREAEWGVLE